MSNPMWNGRAVTFADFTIAAGREVRAAFAVDAERGSWVMLVKSARYADDGTPVFRSVEEIETLPYKLSQRIMWLASKAAEANKVEEPEIVDDQGEQVPLH